MKKILAIIIVLLFLLLLWWTKNTYEDCCKNNKTQPVKVEKPKPQEPLVYSWNSSEAITSNKWNSKKEEILSQQKEGKILQISGPYFKEEGEKVGLDRAKNVFNLMSDKIDSSKVELKSHLVNFYDKAKTTKFAHTKFNWLTRNKNIQEIDNKALIYFPTNSTKKVENVNINNYLNDVVTHLKNNHKKIILTGHSDNRGKKSLNYKLALKRAESIRDLLISKGINANRITTSSKGEEVPIASNNTKEGQQKNRRVELEIN